MKTFAYAKLNLALDILGREPDGYHNLRMIMQSVDLADEIDVEITRDGRFSFSSEQLSLPTDERNLAVKAAMLFLKNTGFGASIRILKRIPVGAGMGGGSADAAAVLRALNAMTGWPMSAGQLCRLGMLVGSDVPFCLVNGTALAEHRGEKLTSLPSLPDCPILICKPAFSISTPALFQRADQRKSRLKPDIHGMVEALQKGDILELSRRMYNVFEDVLDRTQQEIFTIKSLFTDLGAVGTVMTGTGSAVFGLFEEEDPARAAFHFLSSQYRECYLTRPSPATPVQPLRNG